MIKYNFPAMLLLTYTPRLDANIKEYEDWLRKVDNPFFNNINGISHYTNWKIINKNNNIKFTYFDFLAFDDINSFDSVWHSKEVIDFTSNWRVMWGKDPNNEDLSLNAMVYLLERVCHRSLNINKNISIEFLSTAKKAENKNQVWKLKKSLRKEAFFKHFIISTNKKKLENSFWALGELVATP